MTCEATEGGHRLTAATLADAAGHPDLVITVGGDGTFLRGASVNDVPVLGVDLGPEVPDLAGAVPQRTRRI